MVTVADPRWRQRTSLRERVTLSIEQKSRFVQLLWKGIWRTTWSHLNPHQIAGSWNFTAAMFTTKWICILQEPCQRREQNRNCLKGRRKAKVCVLQNYGNLNSWAIPCTFTWATEYYKLILSFPSPPHRYYQTSDLWTFHNYEHPISLGVRIFEVLLYTLAQMTVQNSFSTHYSFVSNGVPYYVYDEQN